MQFIKRFWKQLLGAIGTIVGLIMLRQHFTKDLLAKLGLAKSEKDSAVLDEKIKQQESAIASETKQSEQLRDSANQKAPNLDPKAVEDYWNKK
jgi:hypothetical protein